MEAESVWLQAEYVAAAAISKVYEDAIKEDEEQYLSSDDPYPDEKPEPYGTEPSRQAGRPISGETLSWKGNLSTLYRAMVRTDVRFEYASEPLREQFEDTLSENEQVSVPIIPMQQNIANTSQGAVIEDTPAVTSNMNVCVPLEKDGTAATLTHTISR